MMIIEGKGSDVKLDDHDDSEIDEGELRFQGSGMTFE